MHLSEYAGYDAVGLAELITKGDVTAEELALLTLTAIEELNPELNAVIETFPDRAGSDHVSSLAQGPLRGVPCLNKDLSFPEKGSLMEMGSQMMAGHVATYDAVATERLRAAGLNNLGRTTTPEFGLVGVTESRLTGTTRNPWDLSTTPSGSSGGSASAIAAGIVPVATASDGGGSIRGPAANCGLVGLKPSRGRVSLGPNRGESLCGLGVIFALTRTVRDTALLLDCLQGPAAGDPPGPVPPVQRFCDETNAPLSPLRIAFTDKLWGHESVCPEIRECLNGVLRVLEQGKHLVEEARPDLSYEPFLDATLKVWSADLAAGIDGPPGSPEPNATAEFLQSTTLEMLRYGRSLSATELLQALRHFGDISGCVGCFFDRHDILITPSSAAAAQKIGTFQCDPEGPVDLEDWNRQIYKHDSFYPLYNATGHPAISLPLGETRCGLPIGIQLAAAWGNESLLIRVASFLETAMPWYDRRPPVHVSNAA